MCYSAQIRADYRDFTRLFGAQMSLKEFAKTFYQRMQDARLKIPKAMEAAFEHPNPDVPEEMEIKRLIDMHKAAQAAKFEAELFTQRTRLVEVERKLKTKQTKTALKEQEVASRKESKAKLDLSDLRRTDLLDRDARIFPKVYAPVMVVQDGKKVVLPMRYLLRPQGASPDFDREFSGCYNARRDNLEKFWRKQFGYRHGVLIVNAFYENVERHKMEHRELGPGEEKENVVLEFKPRPTQDMLVACLWSRWTREGEPDLLSFAAITDEPPEEVAAAGHDRCIVPIRPENVDAWLNPDPKNLQALYDILDDRERPYYEHRIDRMAA